MGFVWNVGRGTHNEYVVAGSNVEQLNELLTK